MLSDTWRDIGKGFVDLLICELTLKRDKYNCIASYRCDSVCSMQKFLCCLDCLAVLTMYLVLYSSCCTVVKTDLAVTLSS